MSMDTRNGWIAIIGAATLGFILIGALAGMAVLAWAHDGQLATEAFTTFGQILTIGIPAICSVFGINQLVNGYTASKAIAATSNVQATALANGATSVPSVPSVPSMPSMPSVAAPAPVAAPVTVPIVTPAAPAATPETLSSDPGGVDTATATATALPTGAAL